jgi:hypothetical protein
VETFLISDASCALKDMPQRVKKGQVDSIAPIKKHFLTELSVHEKVVAFLDDRVEEELGREASSFEFHTGGQVL